jgi:hypothetical protein
VTTHSCHAPYDRALGERDYHALGELTVVNARYLSALRDDARRRTAITTWYGYHGGIFAWREWRALRAEFTLRSAEFVAGLDTARLAPATGSSRCA